MNIPPFATLTEGGFLYPKSVQRVKGRKLFKNLEGFEIDKDRFKRALSDFTLAFAFIDRKVEEEMRNKFNCWFMTPLAEELREEREGTIKYSKH